MKKLLLYLFVFTTSSIIAQKVAIVGLNHVSSPDGFTFVATENLSVGEVIYFTENEYNNSTNKFNDLNESVVKFTVTTAINKGNVVYVAETGITTDTLTVTASSGAGTAVKTSSSSNFAIATSGESLYAYSDTDENPTNGVTEIYAVIYTGISSASGGNIPAIENPVPDFSNAILVHGFPAIAPNRVEFNTSVADRTNVSKAKLENINNYVHGQAHQALSTTVFTNLNLSGVNPVLTVNATGSPVAENSGSSITYTFALNTAATSNITINFSVGGSATFGTDYTQSGAASFNATSGTVVIANGTTSKSITITPTNEAILEPNETIILTATSGTGYDVGGPSNATGQINNDDTLNVTPLVAVTGINHTVNKGFSFVILKDLSAGQTIYFTENSFVNTALSFTGVEAVIKWTVPTGGITRGKVVAVKETTANTYAVSCSSGTSCGTINHISGEFTPSLEGESFFAYTDGDDNHTNGVTEVHSALVTGRSAVTGPGGAIATSENIALLYTGAVVADNFPTINPNRVEYNPSLRNTTVDQANFQNTTNWLHAQANQDLSVTPFNSIIISEGATNPSVSVAVSPSSVEELATNSLTYTFTLSSTATQNITVNFDVSGNATYTTDYTITNANTFSASTGSVIISNGTSSSTITITPVNDIEIEPEEEITLTLSSGSGYNGGSPSIATGKITNNDTNTNTSLIAVLGINHETPDGFSFVTKENIAPNTTFYFTDNTFTNSSLSFTNTEAVIQYTSPDTCIEKGTVFTIKENTANILNLDCQSGNCGTVSLTGEFSTSSSGEAFYAYQDTDNNPSNGIIQIHSVLFTEGGNIPTANNPKNTYTNAVVTDGFPATSPNKTEFKTANRNTEVTTALLEDISNWEHAQVNIDLSSTNFTTQPFIPKTIYVNTSITTSGDGSSWTTAYKTLQEALASKNPCATDEIWVATGTYKPINETTPINIPANTIIYGGFNGTETTADERNWFNNPTILSGDLNNNNNTDAGDAHTIVTLLSNNSTISGFVFENAFADGAENTPDAIGRTGAGIYNTGNNNITNCVFKNLNAAGNGSTGVGGAIISFSGNLTITNSLFYNNIASGNGGAISIEGGTVNLINATLANNTATNGGGVHFFNGSLVAVNSIFTNNSGTNGNINNASGAGTGSVSYSLFFNSTAGNNGNIPPNITDNGNNILNTDPIYASDFQLTTSSTVLDLGNTAANTTTKDLAGNNRVINSTIDMGAYELPEPSFTELTATNLTGVDESSVAWGDYDNDGDLDILLTGEDNGNNRISKIYTNNAGTFTELTAANLTGVAFSSAAWGDYDNDGDLDILLTGNNNSKIYTNNAGTFTELTSANLTGVYNSSVAWGDYDNDGDLDILLTGSTGSTRISKIYTNNAGTFTELSTANLTGVFYSSVAWGDYDNDGDLDILLTGYPGIFPISKIYTNNAGTFTELTSANLTGVSRSSTAWGDYDNDGDLDILLTGWTGSTRISKIYTNNAGTFTELNTNNLTGVFNSSAAWGDYDNDGDLDILLTGNTNGNNFISKIYTNNAEAPNTAPTAPSNPTATVNENTVTLNWDTSTDVQTPTSGLSYNVYIKENPVGTPLYVKTPMAEENTGWRKLPALGNAQQNNSYTWQIPNSYCGTSTDFTFKVQAIDHNFAGSAFSTEASFSINLSTAQEVIYVNTANVSGTENGLTWATAYTSLQDALIDTSLCADEIWVAAGTYKPTDQITPIYIPKGITLLGGFNGTETTADARNWNANPTILSGDLNNSNTANTGDAHTIVKIENNNITIDGFIFENSYADAITNLEDRSGGALFISNSTNPENITIQNSIFRNNHAIGTGDNGVGGAIISYGNNHSFTNCLFYNNSTSNSGGALSPQLGDNLSITNCTFAQNTATTQGGAIHNDNVSVAIVNSIFAENTATTNKNINNASAISINMSYSLLDEALPLADGGDVTDGGNNLTNTNPDFLDANTNDYRLKIKSLALNAGDDSKNAQTKDLAGNPRKTETIDMGAYEYDAVITKWTGTTGSNWNDTNNWTNGIPSETKSALFGGSVSNEPNVTISNAMAKDVLLDTGITLTIDTDKSLTINRDFTNNGSFIIKSDATSNGSFILKGNYNGSSTTDYHRYLTTNWHLIAAPVDGININTFKNEVTTNGNKYAIAPYDNSLAFGARYHYYTDNTGTNDIDFAGFFETGKGYSIKKTTEGVLNFSGFLNTNDVTISLTDNSSGIGNKWNLVGNPYTSFINLNDDAHTTNNFLTVNASKLDPARVAVYLWNTATGSYDIINHATPGNAKYAAPGQGFFVEAKDGGANINFKESLQSHQTGNLFSRTANIVPEITLSISDNTNLKSTQIKYFNTTTKGLDIGYDAGVFSGNTTAFSVYTHLVSESKGVDFALQCLPNTNYESIIIPVGVKAQTGLEITFSAKALHLPDGTNIYLEDRVKNVFTALNNTNNYTITTDIALEGIGRFYLHTTSTVLSIDTPKPLENISIYTTNNHNVRIVGVKNQTATVTFYTTLGKKAFTTKFTGNRINDIELPLLSTGVYIVQLQTETKILNKKLIIK